MLFVAWSSLPSTTGRSTLILGMMRLATGASLAGIAGTVVDIAVSAGAGDATEGRGPRPHPTVHSTTATDTANIPTRHLVARGCAVVAALVSVIVRFLSCGRHRRPVVNKGRCRGRREMPWHLPPS